MTNRAIVLPLGPEHLEMIRFGVLPDEIKEMILEQAEPNELEDRYREAAQRFVRDGDLELDDIPAVSLSEDEGAYVHMWKFISASDLETT